MTTQVLYRKASVDSKVAQAEIRAKRPDVTEILEFETKIATQADAAKARAAVGDMIYVATVRVAGDDEESSESDEGGSTPPKPESDSGDSGESEASDESDSPPDADGASEGAPGDSVDDGGLHEPKELSPDEKIVHLLTQILDAISSGGGLGGPKPPHAGPKPGLGGPPPGGPAGPGAGGPPPGPGGPAGAGAPLPPPAKPMGAGGPTFAHYDSTQREIDLVRKEAGQIGTRTLIKETEALYPTHRVAKVNRSGVATIDGLKVDLAQNDFALLKLVSR